MKRMKIVLAVLIVLVMTAAMMTPLFANDFQAEIGKLAVKNSTPTVDGVINADEYGAAGTLDRYSMSPSYSPRSEVLITAPISFAWDEKNLYVAADITDPSFIESTEVKDIPSEARHEEAIAYDGDVFTFSIDPLGAFYENGFTQNSDYGIWYSVSIVDGEVQAYRSNYACGDITSEVQLAGSKTDNGWKFEMSIPWNLIIEDSLGYAKGDIEEDEISFKNITSLGATSRAMIIYTDRGLKEGDFARFADDSVGDGELFTISLETSTSTLTRDGVPANMADNILCFKAFGIMLAMGDTSGEMPPETQAPETTVAPETEPETQDPSETTEFDPMAIVESNKGGGANGGQDGQGGGAPIGLIIGIVAAVAVAAGVVFFLLNKKKNAPAPKSANTVSYDSAPVNNTAAPEAEKAAADVSEAADEAEEFVEEEFVDEEVIDDEDEK